MSEYNKIVLRKAFKAIFESDNVDEAIIAHYFSPDYIQWVDGHELDYSGFINHLKAQKMRVARVNIDFKSLVAEGNKVASIHLIDAMTRDGHPVIGKVVAQFTFKEGKILACEELTFIQHAREEDKNLGSVR